MRTEKSLLPQHRRIRKSVGENVRLARLRRKLSAAKVAERAGISRNTLYMLEKGEGNTSITTLFQILVVLGLENDFSKLASDDQLGRRLEDANLKSPHSEPLKLSRQPRVKKRPTNDSRNPCLRRLATVGLVFYSGDTNLERPKDSRLVSQTLLWFCLAWPLWAVVAVLSNGSGGIRHFLIRYEQPSQVWVTIGLSIQCIVDPCQVEKTP